MTLISKINNNSDGANHKELRQEFNKLKEYYKGEPYQALILKHALNKLSALRLMLLFFRSSCDTYFKTLTVSTIIRMPSAYIKQQNSL